MEKNWVGEAEPDESGLSWLRTGKTTLESGIARASPPEPLTKQALGGLVAKPVAEPEPSQRPP
jgi:hypothetical protein